MRLNTFSTFGIDIPLGATGEVTITCPKCSHLRKNKRAKCLSINTTKGVWFCHHCFWKGTLSQGQTAASEPEPYGAPLNQKEWNKPRPIPEVVQPQIWREYISFMGNRGITQEIVTRNHITVATEWCRMCEEMTPHILFPYMRGETHVNTKHRCFNKHFRTERGAERIFYGLNDIEGKDTVVIVEGEFDKLAFEVAGIRNVVSVPDGAPAANTKDYSSKFEFLKSCEELMRNMKKIILAVDSDGPGQILERELSRRFGLEKCSRVTWPYGIKDANECLIKIGWQELVRVIKDAEPYPIEGMISGYDDKGDYEMLYQDGPNPGVRIGWQEFDKRYRARKGLVTIITGIPGHGKSSFVSNLIIKIAETHKWNIAICSPENQPVTYHKATLASVIIGKPFFGPNRMTKEESHQAFDWMSERLTFILPENMGLDTILEYAKICVYRYGISGLVIDPWNEIEHHRPNGKTETEYVGDCLTKIRNFARQYDVHIWLVVHPTKMELNKDGTEPVPSLWNCSGSAHFRSKADYGLTVWRDLQNDDEPVQVHVTKIRFTPTGRVGMIEFRFNQETETYTEIGAVK